VSADRLQPWLKRWRLEADGEPLVTLTSVLLPVLHLGNPAMLKVALIEEEARGLRQLAWWRGRGAATVLEWGSDALLMKRAPGRSLAALVADGCDEEATSILCRIAGQLHQPIPANGPAMVPLNEWFASLLASKDQSEDLRTAAAHARRLLADGEPEVALHGDLHHHNVLDFGQRDWRAIDAKGLRGERTFDFVALLRNPDAETSTAPGRLETRVRQVATEAHLSARRLLAWTVAFSGLSAVWTIADGDCPSDDLALLRQAEGLLSQP
jgi:streptomycin 6-kinase